LGFFFKKFPALGEWAASRHSSVYAIDWLGMGRSARVPFVVDAKRDDIPGRVREAEAFFIDSLEEWREKMKLEKVTLVSVGFGAYISVTYALKYPTRVSRLVLLSPAGFQRGPIPFGPWRGVTSDQVNDPDYISVGDAQLATEPKVKRTTSEQRGEEKSGDVPRHLLGRVSQLPKIVRSAMWFGPILVRMHVVGLHGLTAEELRELYDYFLNITLAKGSGEYCMRG